jgi:hypothetical protein
MTAKALKIQLNTHLFLRLGLNHLAREAGSFALLITLKSTLRAHAHLLKEALEVPSSFAFYINSLKAFITLEKHSKLIVTFIKNC